MRILGSISSMLFKALRAVGFVGVGVGVDHVNDLSNTVPGSKQQQNALLIDPRGERGGMSD